MCASQDAAAAFCERHGLPADVIGPLADHIADNLARALAYPDGGRSLTSGDGGFTNGGSAASDTMAARQNGKISVAGHADSGSGSPSSGGDSFVSDGPLPDAAAVPAADVAYMAPASPQKRASWGHDTQGAGAAALPESSGEQSAATEQEAFPGDHGADEEEEEEGQSCLLPVSSRRGTTLGFSASAQTQGPA